MPQIAMNNFKDGKTVSGYMLKISALETSKWANKPKAAWPCSTLSGKSVRVEVDSNGLSDVLINGKASKDDLDANELEALVFDHLPKHLKHLWPAWEKDEACKTCDGTKHVRSLGRDNDEIVEDCPECCPTTVHIPTSPTGRTPSQPGGTPQERQDDARYMDAAKQGKQLAERVAQLAMSSGGDRVMRLAFIAAIRNQIHRTEQQQVVSLMLELIKTLSTAEYDLRNQYAVQTCGNLVKAVPDAFKYAPPLI